MLPLPDYSQLEVQKLAKNGLESIQNGPLGVAGSGLSWLDFERLGRILDYFHYIPKHLRMTPDWISDRSYCVPDPTR